MRILMLTIIIFNQLIGIAQTQLAQTPNMKLSGQNPYLYLGKVENLHSFLLRTNKYWMVKKYNNDMAEVSTIATPIIPLDAENIFFSIDKNICQIIYQYNNDENRNIYIQKFDTLFYAIDKPKVLQEIPLYNHEFECTVIQSENKQVIGTYFLCKQKGEFVFNYCISTIFQSNQKAKSIEVKNAKASISTSLYVFNNGSGAITQTFADGNDIIDSLKFGWVKNNEDVILKNVDLGMKCNYLLAKTFANPDKLILCLPHEADNAYDKNCIVKIEINDAELGSLKIIDIKTKNGSIENFYANYLPRQLVMQSDGSILLMSEFFDYQEISMSNDFSISMPRGGNPFRTNRSSKRYFYKDVVLFLIDKNDDLKQVYKVSKEQMSENDEGIFLSFSSAILKDNIALVYNANGKYNTIQQALVNTQGAVTFAILNDIKIDAINMVFKKGKQVSPTELIVPCEHGNVYSFVKFSFQ